MAAMRVAPILSAPAPAARRAARPATAVLMFGKVAAAKKELKALVDRSRRGTDAAVPRAAVEAAIDALLEAAGPNRKPATANAVSATWRLTWTSEREVLWLIDRAPSIFNTTVGEVYQALNLTDDPTSGTLSNAVEFPPKGLFLVGSTAAVAAGQPTNAPLRVNFRFTTARLDCPLGRVPLPPVGRGWFDNVWVDDDTRIARDVRGDTLICARDGRPRAFG